MEVTAEDKNLLDVGCTADYSLAKMQKLTEVSVTHARFSRLKGIPERGPRNKKFLTRCVWVNNNRLKSMQGLELFINSIMEYPIETGWIDFSFNFISKIDEVILKYPNLKILYLHGNCIDDLTELVKLRGLKKLKTVTFHGNPISNLPIYRNFVMHVLPQVLNLDFVPITKTEKSSPTPSQFKNLFKTLK